MNLKCRRLRGLRVFAFGWSKRRHGAEERMRARSRRISGEFSGGATAPVRSILEGPLRKFSAGQPLKTASMVISFSAVPQATQALRHNFSKHV